MIAPRVFCFKELDFRPGRITFATELGTAAPEALTRIVTRAVGDYVPVGRLKGTNRYQLLPKSELTPDDIRSVAAVLSALTVHRASAEDAPDLSMSLGWHTIPGLGIKRTELGEMEYLAKWSGDEPSTDGLCERIVRLLAQHRMLGRARTVVACPSQYQLTLRLSAAAANALGARLVVATKIDPSRRQLVQDEAATSFHEAFDGPRANIRVQVDNVVEPVLIIDDVYSSGGTIAEVTRCLRTGGFSRVYSLTATKTVTSHRQV